MVFSERTSYIFIKKIQIIYFFKTQSRVFTPFSGRKRRIYAGNGVNTPSTGLLQYWTVFNLKNKFIGFLVDFCLVCKKCYEKAVKSTIFELYIFGVAENFWLNGGGLLVKSPYMILLWNYQNFWDKSSPSYQHIQLIYLIYWS